MCRRSLTRAKQPTFSGAVSSWCPETTNIIAAAFERIAPHCAAGDRTVTVLDRGEASIERGGAPLRILGATLWTDYAVAGDPAAAMTAAEREIYDHRLIRRSEGSGFFSPVDALAEHRLSRTWLLRKLTEPADGPTLVVTHHVPHSAARHPGHGLNELAPAFCSDCDDLVEAASAAGVAAWIFGHHHWSLATETRGVS